MQEKVLTRCRKDTINENPYAHWRMHTDVVALILLRGQKWKSSAYFVDEEVGLGKFKVNKL